MAVPRYNALYKLDDPGADRPYRGKFQGRDLGLELSRGEAKCDYPIRVTWAMGGAEPQDITWTTSAFPLIIHARVLEVLETGNFTGWSAYPLEVWSKSGKRLPDYAGLTITGRCGSVDLTRSEIVLREYSGGWYPQFLGHYFAEDSWDESDLFMEMPDSLGKITANRFVTQRVRDALQQAGVGNVRFTRLNELCASLLRLRNRIETSATERFRAPR
jgi:hypothetical protein